MAERALFLAPETPYPMLGGGAIRSASILEYLSRSYEVDAIIFRQPGHSDPRAAMPEGRVSRLEVIDLRHHSRTGWARLTRNAMRLARRVPPLLDRFSGYTEPIANFLRGRRYRLGVIEHFWCAPYCDLVAEHCERAVLNLHNIESEWHARCAEAAIRAGHPGGPSKALAHQLFRDASRELERQWLPRFPLLLTTSEEDARRARLIAPETRVVVYPNALPLVPQPRLPERDVIVFSGSFDYDPNREAVRHFARRIWPHLRVHWPELRWRLVGRNSTAIEKYVIGDPRIDCSGEVEDAIAELAAAKVAVVPLLAGSGTRLKIIEAWAAGRPVVSTSLGAEGLPAEHGENILIEDDPRRFAASVADLLACPAERRRMGAAGRATYEQALTWQSAWSGLDHQLGLLPEPAEISRRSACV